MPYLYSLFRGMGVSAGLIMAIGVQNTFVLKQGITRNHIFLTAFTCSLIDSILIGLGVGGLGQAISENSFLLKVAKWGGILFLSLYAAFSLRAAFQKKNLLVGETRSKPSLSMVLLTLLSVSLLNPHVYLDTVLLVGSIGSQHEGFERVTFAMGAMLASFAWFFSLCYGAQRLEPVFRKPMAWQCLNGLVALMMASIAVSLAFSK